MGASRTAFEQLLEEGALRGKKPGSLLSGTSARLTRASDLALPARAALPLAASPSRVHAPLERLLGGFPRGRLVELVGRRSSGRHSLALAALASVTSSGDAAAFVDLGDHLDPQAAARAGVDLDRLLWVRPPRLKSALASAEMLLATGFPLVVADLGLSPRGARYLPDSAWVRLARAAQAQGASLFLITPWRMTGVAAETVVSADVARPVWLGSGSSPRLLDGISSRVTLDKFGRETPGTSVPVCLRAGEAPPSFLPGEIAIERTQTGPTGKRTPTGEREEGRVSAGIRRGEDPATATAAMLPGEIPALRAPNDPASSRRSA